MSTLGPRILVIGECAGDVTLIASLLQIEFDSVGRVHEIKRSVDALSEQRPDVLVLAFRALEHAERWIRDLSRIATGTTPTTASRIVICHRQQLTQAYALCRQQVFDDYVLFWPVEQDSARLLMSVHLAARRQLTPTRPQSAPLPAQDALDVTRTDRTEAPDDAPTISVLIVDDDEFQHRLLNYQLHDFKLHLSFSRSGQEALAHLGVLRPDLILMDVDLPDGSGIEFTRRISTTPALFGVPVVMITAQDETDTVQQCLAAGAVDYVLKPLQRDVLAGKLRQWLQAEHPTFSPASAAATPLSASTACEDP